MATQVFAFYRLRPDVDVEAYKEWSRTVDQPTCHRMPACHSFEVFLTQRVADGKEFYDVVENIVVESWDAWQDTLSSEEFAQVSAEWPNYADGDSLVIIQGEKI